MKNNNEKQVYNLTLTFMNAQITIDTRNTAEKYYDEVSNNSLGDWRVIEEDLDLDKLVKVLKL